MPCISVGQGTNQLIAPCIGLFPTAKVGVGTSTIQHDMVTEGGYMRIVNVDYSNVCIKRMAEMHANVPQLEYLLVSGPGDSVLSSRNLAWNRNGHLCGIIGAIYQVAHTAHK
jgi:hypothetical protein